MPYKVQRVANGCVVKTTTTGKPHSNHPIPCDRAKAQARILWEKMRASKEKYRRNPVMGESD
jgi:hypothetical protein